jgi:hypothetical protein
LRQPKVFNQYNLSVRKGKLMSEETLQLLLGSAISLLGEAEDRTKNSRESAEYFALTAIGKALVVTAYQLSTIAQQLAAINQHLRKD